MVPLQNPHHQMIPIYDFPNGSFYRTPILEVVISGHTEPYKGNSMSILSPVTPETYPIRETLQTKCYHAYGHQVGWVIRYPIHSLHSD